MPQNLSFSVLPWALKPLFAVWCPWPLPTDVASLYNCMSQKNKQLHIWAEEKKTCKPPCSLGMRIYPHSLSHHSLSPLFGAPTHNLYFSPRTMHFEESSPSRTSGGMNLKHASIRDTRRNRGIDEMFWFL